MYDREEMLRRLDSMDEKKPKESLSALRFKIMRERPYVDVKPYSHNIISLVLQQIARDYGELEANAAIQDFRLTKLGWKEEGMKLKHKGTIIVVRTEQWEWTAKLGKVTATGSSETTAELNLLRKLYWGTDEKKPREEQCL